MMKAFLFNKQTAGEGTGSASSTDAWIPKDADDALDKLKTLAGHSANPEVLEFAKTLTASKKAPDLEERVRPKHGVSGSNTMIEEPSQGYVHAPHAVYQT